MKKVASIKDLNKLAENARAKMAEREAKTQVKVHLGTCGISSGAREVLDAFHNGVVEKNLTNVVISNAGCIGLCGCEPVVTIEIPGEKKVIYNNLDKARVNRIINEHLIEGKPVSEWAMDLDDPQFKYQEIRIMHNQGFDPTDIEQYIARGGYLALGRALTSMTPDEVLEEVKKAGLRGRGGAGFPAAIKWGFVRSAQSDTKYVVCNGDEGDPGAYMNRAILEGNPHSIIEGMALGAYAIGNVRQGYAYVRAEYPLAIETLSHAIAQVRAMGLMGDNILDTDFSFSLDIFPGTGALSAARRQLY